MFQSCFRGWSRGGAACDPAECSILIIRRHPAIPVPVLSCLSLSAGEHGSSGTCTLRERACMYMKKPEKCECETCPRGFYMPRDSKKESCFRCKSCNRAASKIVLSPCNHTSNIVCGCPKGYAFVVQDDRCRLCLKGTWSPGGREQACKNHANCTALGKLHLHDGTNAKDTVCSITDVDKKTTSSVVSTTTLTTTSVQSRNATHVKSEKIVHLLEQGSVIKINPVVIIVVAVLFVVLLLSIMTCWKHKSISDCQELCTLMSMYRRPTESPDRSSINGDTTIPIKEVFSPIERQLSDNRDQVQIELSVKPVHQVSMCIGNALEYRRVPSEISESDDVVEVHASPCEVHFESDSMRFHPVPMEDDENFQTVPEEPFSQYVTPAMSH
uniref:TNFR-Cys domain-containing protein n=1 Tax=Eptatretus burgeri TaxID=7764 RepID=A0A8C4RAV8_EPTBU